MNTRRSTTNPAVTMIAEIENELRPMHRYPTSTSNNLRKHISVEFSELTIEILFNILETIENDFPHATYYIDKEFQDFEPLIINYNSHRSENVDEPSSLFKIEGRLIEVIKLLTSGDIFDILNRIQNVSIEAESIQLENVKVRLTSAEFRKNIKITRVGRANEIENCTICMEEITKGNFKATTPCGHNFHCKCIKEWATKQCEKPLCPLCRHDLRQGIGSSAASLT